MKLLWRLAAVAAALAVGAGFAPKPGYLRIYNASQVAAMISIDGKPAQAAAPGKPVVVQVRPGQHTIVVTRRSAQTTSSLTLSEANASNVNPAVLTWCAAARPSGTTLESPPTCTTLINGG